MMKLRHIFLTAILYLSTTTTSTPVSNNQHNWAIGQTVHTQSGPVKGHAASSAQNVSTYLGIPYAQPPTGRLRFAPPTPYHGHKPIDGSKFGHSCPQSNVFGGDTPANTTGKNLTASGLSALADLKFGYADSSEDCLTLNVWTKPQFGEKPKAVLVWIYGGGFTIGSSADPLFDGQYIADQEDVIVVSFKYIFLHQPKPTFVKAYANLRPSYRTNIFGFPGAPGYRTNLGFLDQRLAIEWVRDNICHFGGDPSRITLFGQSAGGCSIDFYSFAYAHDPIASGLIMQSGTTGVGAFTAETSAESWYSVTSTLGCGDNTTAPATQMACMRSKDTESITAAIPLVNQAYGSAFFWPTVDEQTIFSDYPARLAAGNFAKVPILIGNNDYEAGYYKAVASVFDRYLSDAEWDGFDLYTYTCPSAVRANASLAAGQPTYRYRYFGDFKELELTTEPPSRAYHASEILPIFDTVQAEANTPVSGDLVRVGIYLRGAWGMFARDPVNGLLKYGWPRYDPSGETLVRLAWENSVGPNSGDEAVYDSGCP